MYKNKFLALADRLTANREKELAIKKASMSAFYTELGKEIAKSNKIDCSRSSDKCRQKRVSYMANKQRQ